MVSTTRPISCRTDDSRSGVFSLPWKYFDATMLVAVWDQVLGTSTFSWRKIVWPFSLLIWAVRRSHATASKGETLPSAKNRRNSSPVFAWVERGGSKGGSVFPVVVFWFSAIFVCAIAASAQGGFPRGWGTRLFYPQVRAWWAAAPDSPAGAAESRGELRPGPKHQEDEKKYPIAISPSLATGLQKPISRPAPGRASVLGSRRGTPLVVSVKPGQRGFRLRHPRGAPNHAPPNLGRQYTAWGEVVKQKSPKKHKVFCLSC